MMFLIERERGISVIDGWHDGEWFLRPHPDDLAALRRAPLKEGGLGPAPIRRQVFHRESVVYPTGFVGPLLGTWNWALKRLRPLPPIESCSPELRAEILEAIEVQREPAFETTGGVYTVWVEAEYVSDWTKIANEGGC